MLVIELFLRALGYVREHGRVGRMGPFLDGHPFFDGWETWGPGMPVPLAAMTPASVKAAATAVSDLADFTDGGHGSGPTAARNEPAMENGSGQRLGTP